MMKMNELEEKEWKDFYIYDIFKSLNSKAYHTENLSFKKNSNGIPYITRTADDNGLYGVVENNKDYKINPGNSISYGAETAEFFYQNNKYITGNKMYYLQSDKLNEYNGLFFVAELRKGIKECFSYANGAIPNRVIRKKIMLPVNDKGEPDYEYMERYIQNIENEKRTKYYAYIEQQLTELGRFEKIQPLNQKEWLDFFIDDIFIIKSGKRLESYNMIQGKVPFIGATDSGNGVTNYISNQNDSIDRNVLGVNYNGNGMVIGFYHPYECLFSDDVKRFHLKNHKDNKYILLFFKTIILQQKPKYNYGYKFNETRMKRQIIRVPVTKDGIPDYDYMEQYIKNVLIKKYKTYIDYLKSRLG